MFQGRKLVIATKHNKEQVIAPILERELGVECIVATNFDTDMLGTFTGEIERQDDPLATVRKKCLLAMELMQCDLAVSSEGSFGPHPGFHFVPADEEFLIFIDRKNDLEIFAKELSVETNFSGAEVKTEAELLSFADKVNFPSHGLIIKNSREHFSDLRKGIMDVVELKDSFSRFLSDYGKVYVETDMRAMCNPTRMKVIEAATIKLAKKIKSYCPSCQTPGFGVTDARKGLPCELCQFPTRSVLSFIYECKKCHYSMQEMYPLGKQTEDPTYCDLCNP